jgi:hypothetical protein
VLVGLVLVVVSIGVVRAVGCVVVRVMANN